MIYTSYFGNYKNFPNNSYIIGITRFPISGIENCIDLSPSEKLLRQFKNKEIDEFIFKVRYLNELKQLNKKEYIEYLHKLERFYNNIIICCYEKPNEFCHRHILADWLDMDIKEL